MDRALPAFSSRAASWGARFRAQRGEGGIGRYLIAVAAVAGCTVVRAALHPLLPVDHTAFLVYVLGVLVAAWAGGISAGLFATALSTVVASWLFLSPSGSFAISAEGRVSAVVFLAEGTAISVIAGRLRIALRDRQESEERLRLAQEAAHLGVWEIDTRTGAVYWSEGSERIHGLAPGSFGGDYRASISQVHPDDLAHVRAVRPEDAASGSHLEYRIRRPDGEERWISAYGSRINNARAVGVHIDVTDQKHADDRLRASEARFREMANAAPVLVWVSDRQGHATFFNEPWLRFTGRTLDAELGDSWLEHIHRADIGRFRMAYDRAVGGHEAFETEFRLHAASGDFRWILARGAPIVERGRFAGIVASCIDISERRRATEGIRLLSDVSAGLATSLQPSEVVATLTRVLVPNFADWCTVHLVDADGVVRRVAARHEDPEGQDLLSALGDYAELTDAGEVVRNVIQTGETVFVPAADDEQVRLWAHDEEHLGMLRALRFGSGMALPLVARGKTIGALTLNRGRDSDRYDQSDVDLALEVARRAAQALDNAGLYLESQHREARARKANDALQFLADAGIELSSSLDHRSTLATVARFAVAHFADACVIDVADEDGTLQRVALAAVSREFEAQLEALRGGGGPTEAGQSLLKRLRNGQPILVDDAASIDLGAYTTDATRAAAGQALGVQSLIIVPLRARGRTLGGITLMRTRDERFDRDDLAVAEQLGRRAGLSLDNSRLFAEARRVENELRYSNGVIQFISDASATMADTLDYEEALKRLADLAVPNFADWCAIDIVQPDGALARVTVVHKDQERLELALDLARRYPPELSSDAGMGRLVATGEPLLVPEISDEMLVAGARDAEHLDLLRRLGLASAMAVALSSHGRVFGTVSFIMSEGSHRYNEADLAMAAELGRRAGASIENARLYTEAQERERELVRANEAKDEFLGMMSHELRTPITVIHGGARVLKARAAGLDAETRSGMLEDIERESERLARMLENLLALARVELDQEPTVEPVLVQRLVTRILESGRTLAAGRVVEVRADEGIAPAAADPAYLEHVVRNLISNADKYSPAGRPIDIRVAREGQMAAIRVLDRGFGIAADEADRIFERFYRSDRTAKLAGGAGMGLAVCKRLVESMGGHIWATPREGGGTEVGFTLPLYEEEEQ